jgi:sec-independent protein translocase protein TatA
MLARPSLHKHSASPWRRLVPASLLIVGIESPVHLLFLAAVALMVLGPKRLPELARALGKGIREFRESIDVGSKDEEK